MTAIAIQHREQIIDLASTGASIRDIAAKYGVQAPAISKHLADDPDYRAARETAAQIRLEDREANLEQCAPLMVEISRASQLLSHQRWRCEREFPARWGAKTQVTADLNITVNVSRGITIDAQTVAQTPMLQCDDAHNDVS